MAFTLVNYSQQDPQWKNDRLGFGSSHETIGLYGCALTSAAMLVSGHGFPETPQSLNFKLKNINGFIDSSIIWGSICRLFPRITVKPLILCYDTEAPLAQIDAAVAAGQPVLVQVDSSPQAGLQTHWVVLYQKNGNDYLMLDPWPYPPETGQQLSMMSRYSQGKSLKRAITAVVMYECLASGGGTIPSVPSSSTTTPATTPSTPLPDPIETDVVVQVVSSATAGIRLRNRPGMDSDTLAFEAAGVQLRVIEEKQAALAKIGKDGQWLYVRDPLGNRGYVATWYVQKATAPASSPLADVGASAGSTPDPTPAATPQASTPPPARTPTPRQQAFYVRVRLSVGSNGLRLRKAPTKAGALVAVEKAGAALTVLDPPEKARLKVGTPGQWIYIKDPNGQRGYVMAEYIELAA